MSFEELGSPVDLATLTVNSPPPPIVQGGVLSGVVIHCDHFGNVITNFGADLARAILAAPDSIVTVGGTAISDRAATYAAGPSEKPFLVADSSGYLAIAVRNASAAAWLGAARGTGVRVSGLSW
jgi:S-adenosylmethionine hydrolase